MPVPVGGGMSGPSTFDKWKMGAMMGGSVGLIFGFIFGTYNIMRGGAGANGIMRTLGQYMIGSATTFGFFMSIGTVIRTDTSPEVMQMYARARRRAYVMPTLQQAERRRLQRENGNKVEQNRSE